MSDLYERTRPERNGFTKAETAHGSYHMRRNEHDQFVAAWRAYRQGKRTDPLIEVEDEYGAVVTLDLATIEGVIDFSPATLEAREEDDRIVKLRGDD